jgi:hypothetical protein
MRSAAPCGKASAAAYVQAMEMVRRLRSIRSLASLGWALALATVACEAPYVGRDGTVTFPQQGAHGAAILTANGIEFRDRIDVPQRVLRKTVDEPWRAPVGFILPKDGRFTETSKPTVVAMPGLGFALRPSDQRVPSWGGEVLVRVDVMSPAAAGTARLGENIAIVLDGSGIDSIVLAEDVIAQTGSYDRIMAVDATDAKIVVPLIPANHKSLAEAAIEKRLRTTVRTHRDLAAALRVVRSVIGTGPQRRVVVLSDGEVKPTEAAVAESSVFARGGVPLSVIATRAGVSGDDAMAIAQSGVIDVADDLSAREKSVPVAVPPAGQVVFKNVVLTFSGNPAPSHVLETSGGGVRWRVDSGELLLGDVIAGEARTEVVRVTVPPWSPGSKFTFTVTATAKDAKTGEPRKFSAKIPCIYDDDIERIAESRFGDVIAYASALATLKRLDAAFVGDDVKRAGGIWKLAWLHAQSMSLLARDTHDRAISEQAETLRALLLATR